MSKPLAASQDLMKTYLSELLTEEPVDKPIDVIDKNKIEENQKLNKLLQQVSVTDKHIEADDIVSKKSADLKNLVEVESPVPNDNVKEEIQISTRKSQGDLTLGMSHDYRKGSFQAMFFDVAGLTIAVPLVELGGIHNLGNTTSLMGKPEWFEGVMIHREDKINVVDTALWVMPEKCNAELRKTMNYQYVIMLSNSQWGLMAENLVDTVTLQPEDVKWLDSPSKRPWLAGLVKDRMCALLEVESLIKLLNDGMDIHQI